MRRCSACGKWILGKERLCPNCRADLWEQEAEKKKANPYALLDEADELFSKDQQEKAGVFVQAAFSVLLDPNEKQPFSSLRDAVEILADMYAGSEDCIPDELMADALDILEDLAISHSNPRQQSQAEELRERVSHVMPEATAVPRDTLVLPYQETDWHLPLPEIVIASGRDDEFTPDLTRTQGLSLTEIGYFFYKKRSAAIALLEPLLGLSGEDRTGADVAKVDPSEPIDPDSPRLAGAKEAFYQILMPADSLPLECVGPAADVFWLLMLGLGPAGLDALRKLCRYTPDYSQLPQVYNSCQQAARTLGLYPEELFFTALAAPYLTEEGHLCKAVCEYVEPCLKKLLQVSADTRKNEGDSNYRRQLIQTMTSEYCALYGVMEHMAAVERISKQKVYRKLLENASANGLSIACAELCRNLFYGDNGSEPDMGVAKYYAVILRTRKLHYPIEETVNQIRDLQMEIPGVEG